MNKTPIYNELENEIKELEREIAGSTHTKDNKTINFRTLFYYTSEGILIAELETKRFIYANPALCTMLGYSLNEIKELGVPDIHPHEDLEHVISEFEAQARGEKSLAPTIPCLRKDGSVLYADINTVKMMLNGIACNVGFFTDVTERKKTEEALKESEKRYRELFNRMYSGVAIYEVRDDGADFIFKDFNRAAQQIDQLQKEELIGKSVLEMFPAVKDFGLFDVFQRVWKTGKPEHHPITLYKDDRIYGWRNNFVYKLGSGEIVAVYTDETKRMQAEEALRESQMGLETIFNSIQTGIVIIDKETRKIIMANPIAVTMIGASKDTIIGSLCHQCICPSEKGCCPILDLGQTVDNSERVLLNANGESIPIIKTVVEIVLNGRRYLLESFMDISERKRSETALKKALAKAEESDRLKSAFLANMSHEIRTPLNPILGYADLMLAEELSKEHSDYLNIIIKSGNLLVSIIDDILDISKIEAHQLEIEHIPCSLKSLLDTIESNFTMLIAQEGKNIALRQTFSAKINESIISDPTRLQQILNNLISNAVKFTETGFIEYGVSLKDNDTLEFYVRDTGIGIPEDKQGEIFERFYQADPSYTRKYGGTGLGLTICKKLVELLGGEIKLQSCTGIGHGSTFYFTLPYQPHVVQESHEEVAESILVETKTGSTILIAEDDVENQRVAQSILEKSGYKVVITNDGREAISIYKSHPALDLIVMDVQMPVLDGLEATRVIRDIETREKKDTRIPIIALTAYAMTDDRDKCIDAGMDDYIAKPIKAHELLTRIKMRIPPAKK